MTKNLIKQMLDSSHVSFWLGTTPLEVAAAKLNSSGHTETTYPTLLPWLNSILNHKKISINHSVEVLFGRLISDILRTQLLLGGQGHTGLLNLFFMHNQTINLKSISMLSDWLAMPLDNSITRCFTKR